MKTATKPPETTKEPIGLKTAFETLRVEVIDTLAGLASYEDSWNQLACSTPHGSPVLSYAWVVSWLETQLKPHQTWKCFMVLHGEKLICARPLIVSEIRFLGMRKCRLTPPYDLHTATSDLLCQPDDAEQVVSALMPAIQNAFPDFYCYQYRRVPANSPAISLFNSGYRCGSAILEQLDGCGYLTIEGSFDQFFNSLSQSFTRNLRRLDRKINDLGATTRFITDAESNDECLAKFIKMEASGWKGKEGGGAILLDESLIKFYTVLTQRLAKLGWIEWQILEVDGAPIAIHMGVRCGHVLNLMKIAYDESFGSYSPGSLLIMYMVRRAHEIRPYTEINFQSYGKWQKNWQSNVRNYYNLTVYPRTPVALVRGYLPRKVRAALRNSPWFMAKYRRLRDGKNGTKAAAKEKQAQTDTE